MQDQGAGRGSAITWTVRRRWAPRLGAETLWGRFRRRVTGTGRRGGNIVKGAADSTPDPGCLVDELGAVLLALVALVVIAAVVLLAVFVVVPLLIALLDLVLLLVLVAAGLVGRVIFRRPWTVEARSSGGDRLRWKVVGWRASAERRDEVARLLAAGVVPPDAL